VQSVRGLAIACRSSVCHSVTFLDQDHISLKSCKLIARTISSTPSPFALHCPTAIHLFPGEHGVILGRLMVRWGKVVCWSTKVVISPKRVDRGKVTMERPQELTNRSRGWYRVYFERYHFRPPTPLSLDWTFASPPKNPIPIISGACKATDFLFGQYIRKSHPNKSPLKFWRKESVGVSSDCPNVFRALLRNGKATNSKCCTLGTKAH